MSTDRVTDCVKECDACAVACEKCATACLSESDDKMMADCINWTAIPPTSAGWLLQ
jgi:hypothetical protein